MRCRFAFLPLIGKFSAAAVVLFTTSSIHAQTLTAPTASETPAKIDELWQKASAKYDAPRAALLNEVDDTDRGGAIPRRLGVAEELRGAGVV